MAREQIVYCRVCGEKISSRVKVCPHCGAKQKKGHGFRKFLLLVILAALAYWVYRSGIYKDVIREVQHKVSSTDTTPTEAISRPESTAVQSETSISSSSPEVTPAGAVTTSSAASSNTSSAPQGVTPEFKEYMDAYESFMNKYCDFMETYDSESASLSMLTEYASMMAKYAEFADKVDDYNEDNLSDEDYKYYIDVTARVNKRLIDVAD